MSRLRLSFFAACLIAGLALVYRAPAPLHGQASDPPDVIYYNAKVVTVDDQFSVRRRRWRSRETSSPRSARTTTSGSSQVPQPGRSISRADGHPASRTTTCTTRRRSRRGPLARAHAARGAGGDRRARASRRSRATSSSPNSDWHEAQLEGAAAAAAPRSRRGAAEAPGRRGSRRARVHPELRRAARSGTSRRTTPEPAGRPHHAVSGRRAQR